MGRNGHRGFIPTPRQRLAIEHVHGPMLVVAGAGTGKTAVLSQRIAHLINTGCAKPDEILAVTYTRNGAAELVRRAGGILYHDLDLERAAARLLASGLQANTFHAYCFSLLQESGIKFALLDDQDLFVLLRRRIGELRLERFIHASDPGKFLHDLMEFFRHCHDELRTPDDYDAYVTQVERGEIALPRVAKSKDAEAMPREEVLGRCHEIARAFRYVEDLLKQEGLGTFGHIITRAVEVLSLRQSVLQDAQKRARFILIDEFQDSNVAQIQLARLLAGEESNVFAVGDPDQAIYRFRGATSGAFDQFLKIFGASRVQRVTMSENRRSTPPILGCAYQAIRCNPEVGSKELEDGGWPREPLICARLEREKNLSKAPMVHAIVHNKNEDAAFIAESIESTTRRKPAMSYRDFAVLYRLHNHRGEVADELRRRGIPVQVKGANLFDAPEVRDAMAVLRVLDGPDPVALFRVAALPQFCVDPEQLRAELALAGRNPSVEALLEKVSGGSQVMQAVRGARHDLASANGIVPAAIRIMRSSFQLGDSWPLQRLQEFVADWGNKPRQITRDGTLRELLDYIALFQEGRGSLSEDSADDDPVAALAPREVSGEKQDAVQLMTVHAAKGLEFPCVFVVRVVKQSFPGPFKESLVEFPQELRSKDTAAEGAPRVLHDEEERRLFYVALTRAQDELYICGQFGRGKKDPTPVPPGYMRELLDKKNTSLQGAIECRKLPQITLLDRLHAAESSPLISEWVQLPPRADARLGELSASAIEQYERCPMAYKLSRDWRIPEGPAARMQFGAAMHLALKAYFDGVHAGRPLNQEAVIACFLDEFSKTKIEEELQRELYEKQGREQLTRFLHSDLAKPAGDILHTERSFSFSIGETKVRAKMDRLDQTGDGDVVVVDYKTGKPKTQEDADKSLQLSIYALAARDKRLTASSLVFINLENCTAVQSSRAADDLIKAERKVNEVAAEIAAGKFDPDPGFGCNTCSYHSICPAHEVMAFTPAAHLASETN